MHRLLSQLPDVLNTTVTCYADNICIHSTSTHNLRHLLNTFSKAASDYGLIISADKSRIFSLQNMRLLPDFTIDESAIPPCRQYHYLGAPELIPRATQAQRTHPIVQDLLDQLHKRLTPLKWLVNNATGILIPVARTVYIAYIRSL
ncbi:hypothetical protein E2C01_053908 [Portunus trituberculatus]|uniref:Reverse transcriptase domain-containing protein n=1 Tax=Portunus trituberculatus TaxID=210409 RepID=A0A5B7GQG5_PORTR|nr:hypothetical protein [Portunus trituberculatus]